MAESFFPAYEKIEKKTNKEILSDFVRTEKIGEKVLVTAENGSWALLSKEQYEDLKSGKIKENDALLEELEKTGVIWTNGNIVEVTRDYRNRKSFLFQGTSLHIVIPTLRCNHGCVYCHSNAKPMKSKGYDLDEKTAKRIVDFIFQSPSKNIKIEFQGGEPLLNFPIVKYIIEYAKSINLEKKKALGFNIVTNLSLMTDEMAEFLLKNNVGICTSLDGPKQVHNKNRSLLFGESKDSHERTVYWIKRLREKHKYNNINALMVVTKHSLPHWKEIVDEYAGLGLKNIWLEFVNPLGNAQRNWKDIEYNPDDFLTFWMQSLNYIVKNGIKLKEIGTSIILRKILTKEDPMFLDLQSPCGAAIGQLAYDHNGDIYTCDEGRQFEEFKIGNVKDNYKEILTSPKVCAIVSASTNDTSMCNICAWKPYCGLCPVCTFASQGNIINKLPEDYRCKILKGQFKFIFDRLLSDEKFRKVFLEWAKKRVF
jgi:His-Xaa-Ser system radical SAM maturase HxsB